MNSPNTMIILKNKMPIHIEIIIWIKILTLLIRKKNNKNYSNKYNNKKNSIKKENNKIDESRTNFKLTKIEKIKNGNYSIKNNNNLNDYQKKKYAKCFASYKNINEEMLKYDNDTKKLKSQKNENTEVNKILCQ